MRVLVVCSGNSGRISPFVQEQVDAVSALGIECEIFSIVGKGIKGYLKNFRKLKSAISLFKPDLIHAHSGMSALLCGLQRKVPVVATYHGSDVNDATLRKFTRISILLSKSHILVNKSMRELIRRPEMEVIPCGVDTDVFFPVSMQKAREILGLEMGVPMVLFSSSFHNLVKQSSLALGAVSKSGIPNIQLLELNNKSRQEVALLLNACNLALLTSKSEGSPQFIKEALACSRPIVSTNVGDVKTLLNDLEGCFICSQELDEISKSISDAYLYSLKSFQTLGSERVEALKLDSISIAKQIIQVYLSSLRKNE